LSILNPSRKPFNGKIIMAAIGDKLNANVYLLVKMEKHHNEKLLLVK
jgi:hypothetical protein